jgi:hypothetical protein
MSTLTGHISILQKVSAFPSLLGYDMVDTIRADLYQVHHNQTVHNILTRYYRPDITSSVIGTEEVETEGSQQNGVL